MARPFAGPHRRSASSSSSPRLALPLLGTPLTGVLLALIGGGICIAAIVSLRVRGGGWPMSPYPPQRLVTSGVYALVAHPLYLGSVFLTLGLSIAFRSPAGIWIVTPVLAAACIAFVWGSEAERTEALFGARTYRSYRSYWSY